MQAGCNASMTKNVIRKTTITETLDSRSSVILYIAYKIFGFIWTSFQPILVTRLISIFEKIPRNHFAIIVDSENFFAKMAIQTSSFFIQDGIAPLHVRKKPNVLVSNLSLPTSVPELNYKLFYKLKKVMLV